MKLFPFQYLLIVALISIITANCSLSNKNDSSQTDNASRASIPKEYIRASGRKLVVGSNDTEINLHGFCFGNRVWKNLTLPPADDHDASDFARLKSWHVNAVRFYLNYQLFEDDADPYNYKQSGWDWLDTNIAWAKSNGIYLIFNMHIPQGGYQSLGQGNALWDNPENIKRFKSLWKAIAARYKNEVQVAGYDLLNEPNTSKSKDQWVNLANDLVREIRSADPFHLIIVERLDAINNDWEITDSDMNFFLINDYNIMYTFHFYDPQEYTGQLTEWSAYSNQDGGRYPDSTKLYTPPDSAWAGSITGNAAAPSGNFDWIYIEGIKFKVTDQTVIAGYPVFESDNNAGKVYFDNFVIVEYDDNLNFIKTNFSVDIESPDGWLFWSLNGQGSGNFSTAEGYNGSRSFYISGTTSIAEAVNENYLFKATPGHYYSISGRLKGLNTTGSSYFGINFIKNSTGGELLHRDKEYLSYYISRYINWGKLHNVPLYCGEFGCYIECNLNDKGGTNWIRDVADILKQSGISYTYHCYHEYPYGIFTNDGLPVEGTQLKGISDIFLKAW